MKIPLIVFLLISNILTDKVDTNYTSIGFIFYKSWFFEDGFAGSTITIYKTTNEIIKGIRQINGSGVPVISTEFYDVIIKGTKIEMYNGIEVESKNTLQNKILTIDKENQIVVMNEFKGRNDLNNTVIWSWIDNDVLRKIDLDKLKEIEISEGEIYLKSQIRSIRKEE